MIDDVPCFEENQTLSASLMNSILHSRPSHNCSSLLSLAPSPPPGPETSSLNKMTATWEKSHSQLGGPTSGWLWKKKKLEFWFGVQSQPIPPGHNLSVRKTISKESECIHERELPLQQWWTGPRYAGWIPVQTPSEPAHSTPPMKERKSGAALEQDRFLVWSLLLLLLLVGWFRVFWGDFLCHIFHPASIQSCIYDLIPCRQGCAYKSGSLGFGTRPQGKKKFSEESQFLRQGAEETSKEA